ncbi:hypothetical protein Trydic_g21705 [Trypoxylus dichotomus]
MEDDRISQMVLKPQQRAKQTRSGLRGFDEAKCVQVTTDEVINKIYEILLTDRRVKIRSIVDMVNTSDERILNFLHESLDMKKLSALRVPCLLTYSITKSKEQSKLTGLPSECTPKTAKAIPSSAKVVATVFLGPPTYCFNYLEKGKMITG